ncbi:MAG: LysM peptidoglycan-binding domain-containing protein [Alicyclobacillaceae bacterium]|nr:LysM peptidoglycan-binding domain-containing protein [Alicyclobacillaceae bacterium]
MWIHTVVAGDTLRSIAERYGTSTREMLRLNELPNEQQLVPGLHLLVPGAAYLAVPYTVRRGDTLTAIARRTGISETNLLRWLGTQLVTPGTPAAAAVAQATESVIAQAASRLQAGQVLLLPTPQRTKRSIEVNAYIVPQGRVDDANAVRDVGRWLTYISVFSYQARADGTLVPARDTYVLEAAGQTRSAPLMTVTNFDGQRFNTEMAHTILANGSIRRRLTDNVVRALRSRGFRGVNVDFEHMRPGDRPLYNRFIQELGDVVRPQGFSLSIAMGPKTSDDPQQEWMGAFDYRTLGRLVDFLMLMTYEWGWVGGPPRAVAPLDQVRRVLEYATSEIRPDKILMGMSLYGYDWPYPWQPGMRASGLSNNSAQNLAVNRGSPVEWDVLSASPYFYYRTSEGQQRVVWFDDALSAAAKLHLVYEFGLRGVSYWVLPNSFPQNWYLLEDSFNAQKL